ncbi:hypothetical protein QQ045_018609 [Rhodiola kirilowii]
MQVTIEIPESSNHYIICSLGQPCMVSFTSSNIQYEWNARTQITMWLDNTEEEASLLLDYGNKYRSGLLRDYYGPGAVIYFKYLIEILSTGNNFRLTDWRRECIKLTNDWQSGRNLYSIKSFGSALKTSWWLYDKYLRNSYVSSYISN